MTNKCEYEILAITQDRRYLRVLYKNPWQTKKRIDNPNYAHQERKVPVQYAGSSYNEEETNRIIEDLAHGIYQKMLIKYEQDKPIRATAKAELEEKYPLIESESENDEQSENENDQP